jgi:hypothetical protein
MMGDEVHRVKKVRKKKNSLLTNSTKCAIIKAQKREIASPLKRLHGTLPKTKKAKSV